MGSARLVLASASPARLALLIAAGIQPQVMVSDVDEDEITDRIGDDDPTRLVAALAQAKAETVAQRLRADHRSTASAPTDLAGQTARTFVIGCDSLFTIDGRTWGKPSGPAEAVTRIRAMRDNEGILRTGHHLMDLGSGQAVAGVAETTVRFAAMSDDEIDAYVATGEPLRVAGSFTLDGRSAPWVAGVVGDHTNVVGLSLPLLRELLGRLDTSVVDLWP